MAANVTNQELVIAAGAKQQVPIHGAQLICYQSTDEIKVSLDGRGWLPFARGVELNTPFELLHFFNDTGNTVTLEIAVVSDPKVFIDRRELAASIAVDGGIVTNTAPLSDQGGSIKQLGGSYYNFNFTNSSGAREYHTLISAAVNTNGIRLRRADILTLLATGSGIFIQAGFSRYIIHTLTAAKETISNTNEYHIPAGTAVEGSLVDGDSATFVLAYDIL